VRSAEILPPNGVRLHAGSKTGFACLTGETQRAARAAWARMAHWSVARPAHGLYRLYNTKDSKVMELVVFLPLLIVLGVFMFVASRRQRKAMQATIDLHDSLRVGDRVHTTSGLEATITDITDDTVDLEIAPGVVTTWMKLAIRDRIGDDIDDEEDDESGPEIIESDAVEEPRRLTSD
jgi:preprotein translocase subunit YajC